MTWLVTGAGGMLGTDLVARLDDVVAPGRAELDLTDADAVREALRRHRPDTVVNCAAWTAVDDAETSEDAALAVNGTAVGALVAGCAEIGAKLVQVSTDYVFDGTATEPYPEDAPTAPVNAYGRTKLAGETAVLGYGRGYVVRTAWLYGAHGPSFVRTMARLAGERDTVEVVDDQAGQPTWTGDLADRIIALARADAPAGAYHGTNAGRTTWYGLAREVFALLGHDPARVRPTTSDRFVRPAPRPAFSVLGHGRWAAAGLAPMRDWRDALHAAWPSLTAAWPERQTGSPSLA
ncbi:dTDP-4-dehydrorhamnose reductase [Actinomadura montaniterrae]|uniref:dTDP-4-dehydrorhamnose reductase n=1 Tax=Actinomadura montaniterrae TaxID=1803903 RepID=A0A6L3VUX7_9ACTN|nr:dTDP-4-dehydrorhamnose reductase [Actinomadura montaniterrae]KAB2377507.1 dTDP-4-dehydrorhamnose reductase [Actinomadura montaniterrae]